MKQTSIGVDRTLAVPMPDDGTCLRCGAQFDPAFSCASCLLAVAKSRPEPPDLTGETFGSYTIGRLLGQGGMGVVYEALDTRLGRMVALKMLADDVGASHQLQREAELAASLEHEHIVPIGTWKVLLAFRRTAREC